MNKEMVYKALLELVSSNLSELLTTIEKVQESVEGEEKSTAGDKYETARAMAQNELTQLNRQLAQTKQNLSVLQRIQPGTVHQECQMGSLIKTATKNLYLTVGIGKFEAEGANYIAISPVSPIGQVLLGKKKGDSIKIGPTEEHILEIT
ncbi:MAG: GreA/GreB family elongation factor [Bacteroidia bacterium]|nr:GreA/GreB family elongation factor [Bacteroidia bacterium]